MTTRLRTPRLFSLSEVSILALIATLFAGSCARSEPGDDHSAVRDTAGIEIIENASYAWGEGEGWRVASIPAVDIGAIGGNPAYQMFRVTGATRLANGNIAVANSGTNEVRIYDSRGQYITATGGAGEGPGEFLNLQALWPYRGDSLIAWDYGLHRATVLALGGAVGRVLRIEAAGTNPNILRPFDDGSMILMNRSYDFSTSEIQQQVMELTLHGSDGTFLRSLGTFPYSKSIVIRAGSAPYIGMPWFTPSTSLAVIDSFVYVGEASNPEVDVWTSSGHLNRRIRWKAGDRKVEQRHISASRATKLEAIEDDDLRRQRRAILDRVPSESLFPAYERIVSDSGGRLWVKLFRRPGELSTHRWMVIDSEGRTLGEVSLPEQLIPMEFGENYILGVESDVLGVERVRLYRLEK